MTTELQWSVQHKVEEKPESSTVGQWILRMNANGSQNVSTHHRSSRVKIMG